MIIITVDGPEKERKPIARRLVDDLRLARKVVVHYAVVGFSGWNAVGSGSGTCPPGTEIMVLEQDRGPDGRE